MALWAMHAQSVIQWKGFLHFPETCIVHCKTLNLTIWHFCCEGEKQRNKEIEKNVNHMCTGMKCININFASGLPQNDNMAKTFSMACPYINGKCSKFLSWLAEQSNKVAASQCTGNYGSSL